ncbi:hypothetical protein CDV57_08150, partial [Aspergillus fumigatus]
MTSVGKLLTFSKKGGRRLERKPRKLDRYLEPGAGAVWAQGAHTHGGQGKRPTPGLGPLGESSRPGERCSGWVRCGDCRGGNYEREEGGTP